MISWQQKESDRILCAREKIMNYRYKNDNEKHFWKNLFLDRQNDTKNWNPSSKKDINSINKNDLFYNQTYLNSKDFSCELLSLKKGSHADDHNF